MTFCFQENTDFPSELEAARLELANAASRLRRFGIPLKLPGQWSRFTPMKCDVAMLIWRSLNVCRPGSFGWNVPTGELFWSAETFRILGYESTIRPTLDQVFERDSSGDDRFVRNFDAATKSEANLDFEHRLPRQTAPLASAYSGQGRRGQRKMDRVCGAGDDITGRKLVEEHRRSEADLHHAQRLTGTQLEARPFHREVKATPETYRFSTSSLRRTLPIPTHFGRIYLEDRPRVQELFQRCGNRGNQSMKPTSASSFPMAPFVINARWVTPF